MRRPVRNRIGMICSGILLRIVTFVSAEELMSAYTSMRALDKFGNTVQLKHAREAAMRHGRLVVAAQRGAKEEGMAAEEMVVVVSVGNRKLVSSLMLPLPSTDQPPSRVVAMCCTGVKSDSDWLTRHMQRYVSKVWERYDLHPMSISALAHWLARLLGSYQDDDLQDEWQSSVSRGKRKEEEDIEFSLSRPLGVQSLLLSTFGEGRRGSNPGLLLIEPTGRVFRADSTNAFSFVTMGKESEKLKEALLRRTREDESLEEILTSEILDLLIPSKNEIIELVAEYLGPSKIESVLLRYQSGNLLSREII